MSDSQGGRVGKMADEVTSSLVSEKASEGPGHSEKVEEAILLRIDRVALEEWSGHNVGEEEAGRRLSLVWPEEDNGQLRHWPHLNGRQLEHACPAFTQLHGMQLPLSLHR